jgi:hypothetical protein
MSPRSKVPTLGDMIQSSGWLSLRCLQCSRDRVINAFEAAHRYGHDLTIPEVRALVRSRCKSEPCVASVGFALDHQIPKVVKAKRSNSEGPRVGVIDSDLQGQTGDYRPKQSAS